MYFFELLHRRYLVGALTMPVSTIDPGARRLLRAAQRAFAGSPLATLRVLPCHPYPEDMALKSTSLHRALPLKFGRGGRA
jgi:hypothetical protein